MGLGGHLMWTPLIREIVKSAPEGTKIIPLEGPMNNLRYCGDKEAFKNNPYVANGSDGGPTVPIFLSESRTNYCTYDAPDRCIQRHDKHVIQQICDVYGFGNVELKCELYLTDEEWEFGSEFRGGIVIDPHTKDEYTVNKRYPFEKWQRVVDALRADGHTKIVQVGQRTERVLDGVRDMTGKTTFRQAAAMIGQADLFLGSEGGLMHAANAVRTSAVVIITGFLHPRMTCYPNNTNIWLGDPLKGGHGPCGMKVHCQRCFEECRQHDEFEIVEAVKKVVK